MQIITGRLLGRLAVTGLLGAVVGVVGTGIHRYGPPSGLLLALATVLAAGALARAWAGGAGMLALALGLFTVVSVLAGQGPGGDVLVTRQPISLVWYGGALVVLLAGLLPGRWFAGDAPHDPAR